MMASDYGILCLDRDPRDTRGRLPFFTLKPEPQHVVSALIVREFHQAMPANSNRKNQILTEQIRTGFFLSELAGIAW